MDMSECREDVKPKSTHSRTEADKTCDAVSARFVADPGNDGRELCANNICNSGAHLGALLDDHGQATVHAVLARQQVAELLRSAVRIGRHTRGRINDTNAKHLRVEEKSLRIVCSQVQWRCRRTSRKELLEFSRPQTATTLSKEHPMTISTQHSSCTAPVNAAGVGGHHGGVDEVVHVSEIGHSDREALQVVHGHAGPEETLQAKNKQNSGR
jgi:hypothetical protein